MTLLCNIPKKKNKSLKGNISILFIFILLATSTIVLLAMNQIRHLMEYGETTDDYFKMYYLGKAGIELAMTEVQSRGYGFNHYIDSGDAILQNFDTGADENGYPQNYFTYTIQGRKEYFTSILNTGDIFMIPLFYDLGHNNTSNQIPHSGVLSTGNFYQNYNYENISLSGFQNVGNTGVLFTLMLFDSGLQNMEEINQKTGNKLNRTSFEGRTGILKDYNTTNSGKAYVAIKNITENPLTITGTESSKSKTGIPLYQSEIQVNAHYQDEEMGMEIKYDRPIPRFMGYSAGLSN